VAVEDVYEDGYLTSARWVAAGKAANMLYKRVAAGTLVQVIPGVYRDPNAPVHRYEATFTAYLKVRDTNPKESTTSPGLAVAGAAAAEVWGYGDLHDGPTDIFTKTLTSRLLRRGSIRVFQRPDWFERPFRIVTHWGIPVLRPEWLAVDLLERGIGDRGHVRAMLDQTARSGDLSAGALVSPLATLLGAATQLQRGTLGSSQRAVIIQLGRWTPEPDRHLHREGYGTDLTRPPRPDSPQAEQLRLATCGYWHLDPKRVATIGLVVAARQGRTLAVYKLATPPTPVGDRYVLDLEPITDGSVFDEFVGPDGQTFPPTRNPIRYWESPNG
jgi:hypothetical protein